MRRFDADYLETTRRGMWSDTRDALVDLELGTRESVLDVGCGTGTLTRTLRDQCPGTVLGLDADPTLLATVDPPVVRGDATELPFADESFDLVVCQALLINLPDPLAAVEEFARVAVDAVAVIEPDNSAVTVESTVDAESTLARQAREYYLDGVETDIALGASAADILHEAALHVVSTRRYDLVRKTTPPYSKEALEDAHRKATGNGLTDDRTEILSGSATRAEYDSLREQWRAMGRAVITQMQAGEYERTETVPFFVNVGLT